ncbi:DUF6236 family protein [Nonomuraea sp. NPDC005650]|uniref:DUF6236 family protein n=1 Tax=Nonomuraea sp. NPDC005650 TaxID=3157045 RepID=UPI0033B5AE69
MHQIGLYYPYFHVRNDTWLKAAALYLPQVARVRPPRYPVTDSPTAAALRDELDFLRDVDPGPQATAAAREFETLVAQEAQILQVQYRLSSIPEGSEDSWLLDKTRFAWIHTSQLGLLESAGTSPFVDRLCGLGLATSRRFDPLTGLRDDWQWIGMHPDLVAIYSCALASRIARANALTPVTDDPRMFALPSDGTVDDLSTALLHPTSPSPPPPASDRPAVLYACAAVNSVVPAGIEHVPVEKIVRARRTLSDEFDAFRTHIEALNEEFTLLAGIEDRGILNDRMASMVERNLTKSVRELERGLRSLGMEPIRAVFGLKTLELPPIAALAAPSLEVSPVVGAGGAIVIQLLASVRAARRAAAEQRSSAAGYLLGLQRELDPVGAITRVRRTLLGKP